MHWSEQHEHEIFQHYIQLAQQPGWKPYVWERIKQLESESSKTGFHKGIEKRFVAEMRRINATSASADAGNQRSMT
jgi:hypothetical protein